MSDALALPWLLRFDDCEVVDHRYDFALMQAWGCESRVRDPARALEVCRVLVARVGADLDFVRAPGEAPTERAAAKQRLDEFMAWLPALQLGERDVANVDWVLAWLVDCRSALEDGNVIERGCLVARRFAELDRQLAAASRREDDAAIDSLIRVCNQLCPAKRRAAVPVAMARRLKEVNDFGRELRTWRGLVRQIDSQRRRMTGDLECLPRLEGKLESARGEMEKWRAIARRTGKQIHRTNFEDARRKWKTRRSSVRTVRQRLEKPQKKLRRLEEQQGARPTYSAQ